jgi:multidrug efflux system outer membrane protein
MIDCPSRFRGNAWGVVAIALVLASCSVGPDYQRPEVDLPGSVGLPVVDAPAPERWWTLFQDPLLDKLVDEALVANRDLKAAAARVDQARSQFTIARADQFPSAGIEAERSRTKASTEAGAPLPPDFVTTDTNRLVLRASWELDFWGKYRRASEAAQADLLATEAAHGAVRASLVADVVRGYYALRAADRRLESLVREREGWLKSVELQKLRVDAGAAMEVELRQVQAGLYATEALIPIVRQDRTRSEGALSVLLGRTPRLLMEQPIQRSATLLDDARLSAIEVPAGLPSDLLLRRPDLRQAEGQLHAANARIGVARAAYFPSITLTGYYGGESQQLGDLFSGPARTWNVGAGLLQPLFAAGQIRGGVDLADARTREAAELYQKAVANAFREVRDAIAAQTSARQTLSAQLSREQALARTAELSKLRYDNGAVNLFEVLETERQLILVRLEAIDAERARAAAIVDLYLALGL